MQTVNLMPRGYANTQRSKRRLVISGAVMVAAVRAMCGLARCMDKRAEQRTLVNSMLERDVRDLDRARAAMAPERTRDERQSAALAPQIEDLAERLYGVRFFCPEGGRYLLAPDGHTAHCSLHGSVLAPRQPMAPPPDADLGRLLDSFTDMTATLSFQEEGLHATVTIDRK